ncbi:mannose-1-phosphate guanylyltransferase/mannose-6-phosphate isomerase [Oleidesulfovibrio sp.]|uniref:mannose-1-phosphate guanylyltransferase/mannose-6-phosphate isomerase n=1 Tax=Oleidesulfovibrio sp. TaxID=2909707 RepID=UPI003A899327
MITPVILSGGSGTRLWPLSRKLFPKQLMPMLGEDSSLLQITASRAREAAEGVAPIVVTNEHYRFTIASQLHDIGIAASNIILEPVGRNTAPAVAVAAMAAMRNGDDPVLLVLPADHYINDAPAFVAATQVGREWADKGALVTFGITPDKPEVGYGYIKKGESRTGSDAAFNVAAFVEKPDLETAQQYLDSGAYLWNSGMFMFRASVYLEEIQRFAPEMVDACRRSFDDARHDLDFLRLEAQAFERCPSDSIDYAVMEKTERAVVVPLSCGWSDVGSWSALHEVLQKDAKGNVCIGDVVAEEVQGCYLHSTNRLIAAFGLENIAIVETKDAILAAPLDRVQDVKKIVNALKKTNREEAESHCKVFRPWGNYEGIDLGGRYQVKRITVYPGQTLSLQKHYHRSEHWIVVKGTALVTKGDEQILLSEDQSTYLPLGTVHRLENPGKVNLELIEVQTGSYLGEDDIVRFEDVYGRSDS